jgi:mannose-1-phosphate guanylyltransferase
VVGARCVVGAGATVEGAILWDAVTVGPNAILQDCIVGARARIGAGARLGVTAVVESNTAVPANASR